MKTVPLHGRKAGGRVAIVDDEDYALVMQHRWNVFEPKSARVPYAATRTLCTDGKRRIVFMHNLVMGRKGIDHVNHNGLDNRRENLRPATGTENQGNRRRRRNGSSRYKGVSWNKQLKKWIAHIARDGNVRHLGVFTSEEEAARVYDAAARETFGEFACLNFPGPGESDAHDFSDHESTTGTPPDPGQPRGLGKSVYVGVLWCGPKCKWQARITAGGRKIHLGFYYSEVEAALAYDTRAREIHGEAATQNFPDGLSPELARLMREQQEAGNATAAAVRERQRESASRWWRQRESVSRTCEQCGAEYLTNAVQATKYCGPQCTDRARQKREREKRLASAS